MWTMTSRGFTHSSSSSRIPSFSSQTMFSMYMSLSAMSFRKISFTSGSLRSSSSVRESLLRASCIQEELALPFSVETTGGKLR